MSIVSLITNDIASKANNYARINSNDIRAGSERLSSARFINHGADDPSGLGISRGMVSYARGLRMANTNLQDTINFLRLRDAAMQEAGDMLLRLKELSVRASNEATLTASDRQKMSDEAAALIQGLDQLNEETKLNELKVFGPSVTSIDGGAFGYYNGGIRTVSIDLKSIYDRTGQPVTLNFAWFEAGAEFPDANLLSPDGTEAFGWLYCPFNPFVPGTVESYAPNDGVFTPQPIIMQGANDEFGIGTMDSAASVDYDGWGQHVSATGDYYTEQFIIDDPAEGVWTIIVDNEGATPSSFAIFVNEPTEKPIDGRNVQLGPENKQNIDTGLVDLFEVDSIALGVTANFSSTKYAHTSLESIDGAIEALNTRRAEDGVNMKRFMHTLEDNMSEIINTEAARSRIEDADMAKEITALTRSQVLTQSNTSAAVQANASPALVLDLIAQNSIGDDGLAVPVK
jgi:flagellin